MSNIDENVGTRIVQPSSRNAWITAFGPPSTGPNERKDEWMQTGRLETPSVRIARETSLSVSGGISP